jgi:3-phenylpropionate/trans-cinnamate dioxygenase ferredoxin reductase subunit
LENSVVEFSEIGTKVGAKLEDGRILETDFVIFSIGVLADLTLAKGAGLKTGRGICTNT